MHDIRAVRKENLRALARRYGNVALNRALGKNPRSPYVSQLCTAPDRAPGVAFCRALEAALGLELGYMDIDHAAPAAADTAPVPPVDEAAAALAAVLPPGAALYSIDSDDIRPAARAGDMAALVPAPVPLTPGVYAVRSESGAILWRVIAADTAGALSLTAPGMPGAAAAPVPDSGHLIGRAAWIIRRA